MASDAVLIGRRQVLAWAVMALVLASAACGRAQSTDSTRQESVPPSPQVLEVAAAEYTGRTGDPLEAACRNWRLSSEQVAEFFRLSERYEQSPYAGFYQVPCSISGKLRSEGVAWDFTIGGGATATWTHDEQTRHFGCSAEACAPLVLLPSDGMDPE